ncbi:uncharacterized protein LOC128391884 [Panonychus citri]|uniref:uncharacterized protein LOC128391884 n=1 Tax=Panonychus citri TaxID=50023 RepID=UPI002307D677|nr:uncharacterized protein LOC128391884 [Panonychus citri]XP_053207817.1 uncharacterized protein LOC128391884 [Panonychus citri]
MDNSVIARSGWLIRRVSGKDWRKNWIELYRDGYLKYYENDYSPNPEDVINMPTECISIKTGLQVEESYCPPSGHSSQCVFAVAASGNKKWIFCADTPDDMRAWQLALEQARLLISRPPHHHTHHHHVPHHPHGHHPHHPGYPFNHPSIIHSMRLAGLPNSTLEEYHRLNQYTQLQHMINSRTLPLTFNPNDPRSTSTYPLNLPPPTLPPSSSSSSSSRPSNVSEQSVNSTTISTSNSSSAQPLATTTSIFPIPVPPLSTQHSSASSAGPPRLPCFNFNFGNPNEPLPRPGPLYPAMNQSTSLPPTPLSPQSRIFPFPEQDVRNFNIDVLTNPDARLGANRLVWPPFIWW